MKTTILKTPRVLGMILLAILITLLLIIVMQAARPLLINAGWDQLATVSWNG